MTKQKKFFWNSVVALILIVIGGVIFFRIHQQSDTWAKTTANKQLVVGVDDTFVPMGFRDKNGKLVGFDVDLARKTIQSLGFKVKFQPIDWSMKETELKTGHIDMIWNGYTITPDRQKKVAFSNSYHSDKQVLVTMRTNQIVTPQDMVGKTLGLQTGSSGMLTYDAQPKVLKNFVKSAVQYDTFDKALTDLQVGRIQAVLIDSDFARYYVAHEADPDQFAILDLSYPAEQFAVGFRKKDMTLRRKVNAQLKKFAQDGTLDNISKKYFGTVNQK
ncbi:amino acid ABC transporter substrate-binding protein [Weissella diestrammenae]|uniref:Amino acid ABC transporter substrate-binding protein n=1 Tax=Weissella diestrammenae TaxID=1162633 RepID=A0A7G9T4U3_9LACO|nr:amino acid ABC transporter substrate-binding protein [Weissella diestrammenae]MCM0582831.1 amino acid ABC transporter substrate-binding protein [Weissella diestrammenae]QNN75118.1 amino acid ABC transporter substrate-binding protein [Weissella diestrammenae]